MNMASISDVGWLTSLHAASNAATRRKGRLRPVNDVEETEAAEAVAPVASPTDLAASARGLGPLLDDEAAVLLEEWELDALEEHDEDSI